MATPAVATVTATVRSEVSITWDMPLRMVSPSAFECAGGDHAGPGPAPVLLLRQTQAEVLPWPPRASPHAGRQPGPSRAHRSGASVSTALAIASVPASPHARGPHTASF